MGVRRMFRRGKGPRTAERKLGLRGEILLYIGVLWMINGYLAYHASPIGRPPALHETLPMLPQAVAWAVTGTAGVVFAFQRWPGRDRWGFGALLVMPTARFLSWFASGVLGGLGFGVFPAPPLCFGQALVWGVVCLVVYRIGASQQVLVMSRHQDSPERLRVIEGDITVPIPAPRKGGSP